MSTESSEPQATNQSRRSFLLKLGLGLTALAGVSGGLLRFGKKQPTPLSQEFPGPDSIFHPAEDPRLDPRRR